jgi:hypothetical protein
MACQPIDIDELDPGVREVVRRLRLHDFETCDSGDGVSKPLDEGVLDRPHVFISIPPAKMLEEAHRLQSLVESWISGTEWECDASYNPRDGLAFLFLWDVTDNMLQGR